MIITYTELAKRVGDMVLCNEIATFGNYLILENGSETEKENKDDVTYKDIYQYYIITGRGADYLKEYTDEIVYYHETLDI